MIARAAALVIGLGVVAAIALGVVFAQRLEPVDPGAGEEIFVVERGDGMGRVAARLEERGLVRDARATKWWARLRGQATQLHAGEYLVSASQSPGQMLDLFVSGRVATHPVTIPEGLTAAEIGARIAAAGLADAREFAQAASDAEFARSLGVPADSLEGYLFPETYRLPRGLSAREVARVLVGQFDRAWSQVEEAADARGLSKHEVVTLASIVEKETGAPEERPVIASVFANRLRLGMRLESDPTVIYGIPNFDGNLRRVHLEDEGNPYNSYRHYGLPPGPIASPGLDALRAVVEPAETKFLYFVSRGDGTHHFSKTYREHANMVNRYQKRRRSGGS